MVPQAQTLADRPLDVSFLIRLCSPAMTIQPTAFMDASTQRGSAWAALLWRLYLDCNGHWRRLLSAGCAVKALLPIDPFADLFTAAQLDSVRVPMFYFSGTRSDLHATVVEKFGLTKAPQVYLADLANAAHQNFSWLCPLAQALTAPDCRRRRLRRRSARLTRRAAAARDQRCRCVPADYSLFVAFFRSTLNNESFYDQYLDAQWSQSNQPLVSFQSHRN